MSWLARQAGRFTLQQSTMKQVLVLVIWSVQVFLLIPEVFFQQQKAEQSVIIFTPNQMELFSVLPLKRNPGIPWLRYIKTEPSNFISMVNLLEKPRQFPRK